MILGGWKHKKTGTGRLAKLQDIKQVQFSGIQIQCNFSFKSLKVTSIIGGVQNAPQLFECTFAEQKWCSSGQNFDGQPNTFLG
jgi:hypothetical protein